MAEEAEAAMQLGSTLFYKAQFEVETVESGKDPFLIILDDICRWLEGKGYHLFGDDRNCAAISVGDHIELNHDGYHVEFDSLMCDFDGVFEWAGVLTERSRMERTPNRINLAPRTFTTEIGYKKAAASSNAEFSVILSYIDQPGFLGCYRKEPSPSVPKLIRIMANDERLFCSKSGLNIEDMNALISMDGRAGSINIHSFWRLVCKSDRSYPIVLLCLDRGGKAAVDRSSIQTLYPNVFVCIPDSRRTQYELSRMCPVKGLECGPGVALRIYDVYPRLNIDYLSSDLLRHRFFTWDQAGELNNSELDSLEMILRRALAEDVRTSELDAIVSLRGVQSDIREKKLREQLRQTDNEMASFRQRFEEQRQLNDAQRAEYESRMRDLEKTNNGISKDEIQGLRDMLKAEKEHSRKSEAAANEFMEIAADFERANDRLKNERYGLEQQLLSLKKRRVGKTGNEDSLFVRLASDIMVPTSNDRLRLRIVNLFAERFDERICVTDSALRSVERDCVTSPTLLFVAMWQMCGPLYSVWASDEVGNIEDRYKQADGYITGFKAPLGEGTSTRNDKELMALRRIRFEGRDYLIEPHLGYGNKDDERSIRIYYCWDREKQRLIIGHIGKHLDNATTRKLS